MPWRQPAAAVIWLNSAIRKDEAAKQAEDAGLKVVMNAAQDRDGRPFVENRLIGVNTRTLSSTGRLRPAAHPAHVAHLKKTKPTVAAADDASTQAQSDSSNR